MEDADSVADWYLQIEDASIFDRQIPIPINRAEVIKLCRSLVTDRDKEKCSWFITETIEGEAIAMTGLESINMLHGHAILPCFVAEPWRRTGIGIRMACMMIDLAFKQLRLHRVATFYRSDNSGSEALLSRLGFKQEGISRQSWFSHGEYLDLVNVGILKQEWNQTRTLLQADLNPAITVELGPRPSSLWCWPASD